MITLFTGLNSLSSVSLTLLNGKLAYKTDCFTEELYNCFISFRPYSDAVQLMCMEKYSHARMEVCIETQFCWPFVTLL